MLGSGLPTELVHWHPHGAWGGTLVLSFVTVCVCMRACVWVSPPSPPPPALRSILPACLPRASQNSLHMLSKRLRCQRWINVCSCSFWPGPQSILKLRFSVTLNNPKEIKDWMPSSYPKIWGLNTNPKPESFSWNLQDLEQTSIGNLSSPSIKWADWSLPLSMVWMCGLHKLSHIKKLMGAKTNVNAIGALSTTDYRIVCYRDESLVHASSNYLLAVCYDAPDTAVDLVMQENRQKPLLTSWSYILTGQIKTIHKWYATCQASAKKENSRVKR